MDDILSGREILFDYEKKDKNQDKEFKKKEVKNFEDKEKNMKNEEKEKIEKKNEIQNENIP